MPNSEHVLTDQCSLLTGVTNKSNTFGLEERPEDGHVNVVLQGEHDAIEELFHSLCQRALSDAGREEVIEGLDRASSLCEKYFADEEEVLRKQGSSHLQVHVAAHEQLLAAIGAARKSAAGPGFPLVALDAADLLYDFCEHVKTYDRHCASAQSSE